MKLNRQQEEAIKHEKGPLLIVAGAGTGKTTVIVQRLLHLIKSKKAMPSQILALTFTEKAAEEMQERVDVALPLGYTNMWISTFHGFCDRVLRDEALAVGLTTDYSLLTKVEAIQFISKNIYELDLDYFRPVGSPFKFIDGLITHFSRLQDEDITPTDYLDWVRLKNQELKCNNKTKISEEEKMEIAKWQELSRAYKKYEELKAKNGYFDFGDLITKTLLLFRKRPNVLRDYQEKFKYVLIDEFQDTNYAQFELAVLLAGKNANITVVADDDQSIYRFRGASVSNVIQFREKYPKAKCVVLTQNYRSCQKILDSAYRLIQFNNPNRLEVKEKIQKKLISSRGKEGEIEFLHETTVEKEAERVVDKILDHIKKENRSWGDFAVLVRANSHADPFISAFKQNDIPYQFFGPNRLFTQPEVIDLVSYLKVLTDQSDSLALYRLLSMSELDIPPSELAKINTFAKRKNKSLFEALEKLDEIGVGEETSQKIKKILSVMQSHMGDLKSASSGKILYEFLTDLEIMPLYIEPETEELQRRSANLGALFEKIKRYESAHVGCSVFEVVDWMELASQLGESSHLLENDYRFDDVVNILTIHSSKGLEFPIVFMVNLVNLRFPSVERKDQIPVPEKILKEVLPTGDIHIQEERRLFYVGMTRARDKLYFTAADYYAENASRPKKLSPFVFEALGEEVLKKKEENKYRQNLFPHISYKPKQKTAIIKRSHSVEYLSYSQIETFRACPMHYKLRYILGIPAPFSAASSLGQSIHSTLRDFYLEIKNIRQAKKYFWSMGNKETRGLILDILRKNWISEGYVSKDHEAESFKKAEEMLKNFLKSDFVKRGVPVFLEQPFAVPLKKKGEKPLKIKGVIDRVDEYSDGTIEIVDYKSGSKIPSQKDIDKNLQLSIYALAATSINEPPLGKRPEQIKLTLYYLDEGLSFTTTKTSEQLEKAVDEIYKVRSEIEKSSFECSKSPICNSCEYKIYCRSSAADI